MCQYFLISFQIFHRRGWARKFHTAETNRLYPGRSVCDIPDCILQFINRMIFLFFNSKEDMQQSYGMYLLYLARILGVPGAIDIPTYFWYIIIILSRTAKTAKQQEVLRCSYIRFNNPSFIKPVDLIAEQVDVLLVMTGDHDEFSFFLLRQ